MVGMRTWGNHGNWWVRQFGKIKNWQNGRHDNLGEPWKLVGETILKN